MNFESLKIPKQMSQVSLWVHPEGVVVGSMFLSYCGEDMLPEQPVDVMNQDAAFLVLKRSEPEEVRFYSKAAIVRVEYEERLEAEGEGVNSVACELYMMDGSIISGTIHRFMSPEHGRLYDLLSLKESFIKLHLDDEHVCLVNKAYVVRAKSTD